MRFVPAWWPACIAVAVGACASDPAPEPVAEPEPAPAIVEKFLCSDYCPGPQKLYIRRVYDGVTDEAECEQLGGTPYSYYGWGKRTVCIAP